MNGIVNFLGRKKVVLVTLIVFLLTYLWINGSMGLGKMETISPGASIVDMSFHYSGEGLYRVFEEQTEAGRDFAVNLTTRMDFFFPITYVLFFCALISMVYRKETYVGKLLWMPIGAGVFDFVENGINLYLYSRYPDRLLALASLNGYMTTMKFVFFGGALGICLIGFIRLLQKRRKKS